MWTPPQTLRSSGEAGGLEPVRLAAVNHLQIVLANIGSDRLVEPNSLGLTTDCNMLLCTIRSSGGESRLVQGQAQLISHGKLDDELAGYTTEGDLVSGRGTCSSSPLVIAGVHRANGAPTSVVICASCGRQFRYVRRTTRPRPHRGPGHLALPGSIGLG